MIRLRDILTEISLGGVQPYVTQFTWTPEGRMWWEAKFTADGHPIVFTFVGIGTNTPGGEYAFVMTSQDRSGEGFTVSHSRSTARGGINYLRLLATAAEAIFDFIDTHAPGSIDVTGSDPSSTKKDLQKTHIYRGLLSANAARVATAGYTVLDRSGKLYLVRKSVADSTGIKDV